MKEINEFDRVHSLRYLCFRLKTCEEYDVPLTKIIISEKESYSKAKVKSIKKQIEELEGFDGWSNFSITWDILWIGLDIRYAVWTPLRHNSPQRVMVKPIQLIRKISGHPVLLAAQQKMILDIPIPPQVLEMRKKMFANKAAMEQLAEDEKITEFLSGDVQSKIEKGDA